MTTMATQALSEFALHVRAILGLPVALGEVPLLSAGASAVCLATAFGDTPAVAGVAAAMAVDPSVDVRVFAKPDAPPQPPDGRRPRPRRGRCRRARDRPRRGGLPARGLSAAHCSTTTTESSSRRITPPLAQPARGGLRPAQQRGLRERVGLERRRCQGGRLDDAGVGRKAARGIEQVVGRREALHPAALRDRRRRDGRRR